MMLKLAAGRKLDETNYTFFVFRSKDETGKMHPVLNFKDQFESYAVDQCFSAGGPRSSFCGPRARRRDFLMI